MRAFFQKNSDVKSNNPTANQKDGKIHGAHLLGKLKYLNGASKNDKYIPENFASEHNQQVINYHIPAGTIYKPIPEVTAKYGTSLYKKQIDRYSSELANAFKEYNKFVNL